MIQKILQPAPENSSFVIVKQITPFVRHMLKAKLLALTKGILIHDNLISELDSFVERNKLFENKNYPYTCCPHCLKAHAIKLADDYGLDSNGKYFLISLFKGNIGHGEYYLDNEELKKIPYSINIYFK